MLIPRLVIPDAVQHVDKVVLLVATLHASDGSRATVLPVEDEIVVLARLVLVVVDVCVVLVGVARGPWFALWWRQRAPGVLGEGFEEVWRRLEPLEPVGHTVQCGGGRTGAGIKWIY